jgi:hypothetical protein
LIKINAYALQKHLMMEHKWNVKIVHMFAIIVKKMLLDALHVEVEIIEMIFQSKIIFIS